MVLQLVSYVLNKIEEVLSIKIHAFFFFFPLSYPHVSKKGF